MKNTTKLLAAVALMAVVAGAIIACATWEAEGDASSEGTVYGTLSEPYSSIYASYDELEDGGTYWLVKGGYLRLDLAGIDFEGVEYELAGTGLTIDYIEESIYGYVEQGASFTVGDKTVTIQVSDVYGDSLPVYGVNVITKNVQAFPDAYYGEYYYYSITFDTGRTYWFTRGAASTVSGLTATFIFSDTKCTLTLSGTPVVSGDFNPYLYTTVLGGKVIKDRYNWTSSITVVDDYTVTFNANDNGTVNGKTTYTMTVPRTSPTITLPNMDTTNPDEVFTYWSRSSTNYNIPNLIGTGGETYNISNDYKLSETIVLYAHTAMKQANVPESITVSGATSVQVGSSVTLTGFVNLTDPDADYDSDTVKITWTAKDGASYAQLSSMVVNPTNGGTVTITGLSAGTFTVRCLSVYDSSIYTDWQIVVSQKAVTYYNYSISYESNTTDTVTNMPTNWSTTSNSTSYSATVRTASPVRDGYTFLGWATDPEATSKDYSPGSPITLVYGKNDAVILYAVWQKITPTWYLNFDANGGTGAPVTRTAKVAGSQYTFSIPGLEPVRDDYEFLGWSKSKTSHVSTYSAGGTITVTEDMLSSGNSLTLYAVWGEVADEGYTFQWRYELRGGSGGPSTSTSDAIVQTGSTYQLTVTTKEPTKAGYQFTGWTTLSGSSEPKYRNNSNSSLPSTITLSPGTTLIYACWSQVHYTLTLDTNGGNEADRTLEANDNNFVTIPSDFIPTMDGYTFGYWQETVTASDGATSKVAHYRGELVELSKDTTYTAAWFATSTEETWKFYFILGADDATNGPSSIFQKSESAPTIKIPTTKPKRDGYDFLGWSDIENGTEAVYTPGQEFTPTAISSYFYAVWKLQVNTWTVTFNANGGSGAPGILSAVVADGVTECKFAIPSTTPVWEDHVFDHWSTTYNDAEGSVSVGAGGSYTAHSKSTTLYAIWIEQTKTEFKLIYDLNGGSGGPDPNPQTGKGTDSYQFVVSTAQPKKDGYWFAGWYELANGQGDEVEAGKKYTVTKEETTIHAYWIESDGETLHDFTLRLYANGGAWADGTDPFNVTVQSSTAPVKITIPEDTPQKSDATFRGWSTTQNGSVDYNPGDEYEMTSLKESLYAVWKSDDPSAVAADISLEADGLTITYSATGSNAAVSFKWDFGDASDASWTESGTHTYSEAGTYTVTLKVWSTTGVSDEVSQQITVTEKDGGGSSDGGGISIGIIIAIIVAIVIVALVLRFRL